MPPWTAGKQYSVWRSLAPETITSMGSTCCSRRILRGGLPQLSVLPIRPGGSSQLSHQLGAGCSNSLLYWVFRCVLLAAHVWNTLLWSPMTRFRAVQAGVCANFQPAGRGARILWVLDSWDAGPAPKLPPSVSAGYVSVPSTTYCHPLVQRAAHSAKRPRAKSKHFTGAILQNRHPPILQNRPPQK